MSPESDRVPVPINGRKPTHADEPGPDPVPAADLADPTPEPTPAFTPTQLAIGFGIIASLVLIVAGRMRRRGRSGGGFLGRR